MNKNASNGSATTEELNGEDAKKLIEDATIEEFDESAIALPGSYLQEALAEQALQLTTSIRVNTLGLKAIETLNPNDANTMRVQISGWRRQLTLINREAPGAIALVPMLAELRARQARENRRIAGIS